MDAADLGAASAGPRTAAGRRTLWTSIRVHRAALTRALILLGAHQLCEVSVPVLVGVIVDRAIARHDALEFTRWIAVLATVFVALSVCYRFGARFAMRAAQDEMHRLRLRCARAALGTAGGASAGPVGELLSIANSDADETGNLLRFLPQAGAAMVALAACAAALLAVNIPLGLIVLVAVPVFLSVVQSVAPFVTRVVGAQQHHIGRATAVAADLITGLRPLRGIGAEAAAAQRYRSTNEQARTAMRRAATGHGVFFGTATGVTGLLAVAVATLTGWFALTDRIGVGALIAVLGLAAFLTEPLAVLAMLPGRVATARASAERIARIVDPADSAPGTEPTVFDGDDAVFDRDDAVLGRDDAVFDGDHPPALELLRAAGFDVEAGACVVVTCATPKAARDVIGRLDSIPESLRPNIILVEPHTVDVFTGTLAGNLATGAESLDCAAAVALLSALGSTDILGGAGRDGTGASEGPSTSLDLAITERGHSLSGGQRQRLALTRAMLVDPEILVLHDPTTAVDSITEAQIAAAVRRLRHQERSDRITLVVSNSPAWCDVADRIVAAEKLHTNAVTV